jgi:hypothetical protein
MDIEIAHINLTESKRQHSAEKERDESFHIINILDTHTQRERTTTLSFFHKMKKYIFIALRWRAVGESDVQIYRKVMQTAHHKYTHTHFLSLKLGHLPLYLSLTISFYTNKFYYHALRRKSTKIFYN